MMRVSVPRKSIAHQKRPADTRVAEQQLALFGIAVIRIGEHDLAWILKARAGFLERDAVRLY
jgi:hypothetical protein